MLFASDLDRTLIFSKRFLDVLPQNRSFQVVEVVEGKDQSYITETALQLLERVRNSMTFVPVTTRTKEQYERIQLFHGDQQPDYAVVSNGATILVNGEKDLTWEHHILTRCEAECVSRQDVRATLKERFSENWLLEERDADGWFFYYIVTPSETDETALATFQQWSSQNGWNAILHGRKFYLIPKPINKGDAVRYLHKRLGSPFTISAGDSLLDEPMLSFANVAFTANNSELDHYNLPNVRITQHPGLQSAEHVLLEAILERASKLDAPEILSSKQACMLWGIDSSSLRKRKDDFPQGTIRKFGSTYAVTVSGMRAVFGDPVTSMTEFEKEVTS